MFRIREKQWLKHAQTADIPLRLDELASEDKYNHIASLLRSKIGSKELHGLVSPDDKIFFPASYFSSLVHQQISTKGLVDICDLIDETGLPGELLEHQIFMNVQKIEGFFDLIKRKFYTPPGSFAEINQIIGKNPIIDLKYILNKLYWSEDHLEAVLDLMAQKNHFIGYIDPIKKRLYNFSVLEFSSEDDQRKNIQYLIRFINTNFSMESQVSLKHISSMIQLSEEESLELLEKYRDKISFIFSSDYSYLYPTMDIINQLLKDIYVYQKIPLEFWIQRFGIDRTDLLILLKRLNSSLKGILTPEDFTLISLKDWLKQGIDVESLAKSLNLPILDILEQIFNLTNILNLRLTAGETNNPFLVKGVKEFDIFCQVDTSSHTNPDLYFECQNCKRVICSNCRSSGSKHECPFCGNISAFIIDLPRYCTRCKVNYTHSTNLISSEECYFCKSGPLKIGWTEQDIISTNELALDHNLVKFLNENIELKISLNEIFSVLKRSDTESIALIENYILYGKIQGHISIYEMSLKLIKPREAFLCSICETQKSDLKKYQCSNCDSKICVTCFNEMSTVGMTICPRCGNQIE